MVPGQSQERNSQRGGAWGARLLDPAKKDFKLKRAVGEVPAPPSAGDEEQREHKINWTRLAWCLLQHLHVKRSKEVPTEQSYGQCSKAQAAQQFLDVGCTGESVPAGAAWGRGAEHPQQGWQEGLRVMLASRDSTNPLDSFEIHGFLYCEGLWTQEGLPRQAVRSSSSKRCWTTKSSLLQDTQGSCRQTLNTNPRLWPTNTVLFS